MDLADNPKSLGREQYAKQTTVHFQHHPVTISHHEAEDIYLVINARDIQVYKHLFYIC